MTEQFHLDQVNRNPSPLSEHIYVLAAAFNWTPIHLDRINTWGMGSEHAPKIYLHASLGDEGANY